MKANELRLGNYLIDTVTNEQIQVGYSDFEYLGLEELAINDYAPIPLTEEWLVKFGFEVVKYVSSRIDLPDGFLEFETDFSYGINSSNRAHEMGHWYSGKLKHVHQLQNLYFALTGEELELTK